MSVVPGRKPLGPRAFWLRAIAGIGIALFLVTGPVLGQVFGVRTDRLLPKWRMFSGKGRDVCQLAYHLHLEAGGATVPVDHLAMLGLGKRTSRVRIERDQLPRLNRSLCARLARSHPAPIDLRLVARCGSRGSWIDQSSHQSVCAR